MSPETKKLLQRSDVEEKDRWYLYELFENDESWEKAFESASKLIEEADSFSGKLNDPKQLWGALELRAELSEKVFTLFQYARLHLHLDNRQSTYQEMTDRATFLFSQAGAALAFIEPELMKLTDDQLRELADNFEKSDIYDFYIEELIRSRQHIRSEEVEQLLSLSQTFSGGQENIFNMLDDADIKYPSIKDEQGNEVQLTKQRYSKFMESSDAKVRKDANDNFNKVYQEHINSIGVMLSTEVNKNIFYAKARNYESCLHRSLDGFNIPVDVYNSLLDNTEANIKGLHKWTSLRKKLLKLDKIGMYDMVCPLFPDADYEVSYQEAIDATIACCLPLGKEYTEILKHAFDNRWVDVYETEGKSSGAFSWGNYSNHPYVLMNYNNTVDNMFTLAHELGHALHSYLSNKHQPFSKHQYSIFVAEVASTLNEGLLMQHLLKKTESKEQKLYLLNRHIDNTMGTFLNQVMYSRFELMIHQHVESGQALSADTMTGFWADLTKKYFGPDMTIDEFGGIKWSRVPHFYLNFYVYQYATSYAASQAILQKFIDGEDGIIDKYLTLLKSGGSNYPIELLKECGVDMISPDPVRATIDLFEQQVEQIANLTE
jgi:oligoendopeptidase F